MKHFTRTLIIVAVAIAALIPVSAIKAQADKPTPQKEKEVLKVKEVVLTGRVIDIHSLMTEKPDVSHNKRTVRDCIKAGVPAAIETESGIVIIGHGAKSPRKELASFALQNVDLKGKLYEWKGCRYLDMNSVRPARTEADSEDEYELDDETDDISETELPVVPDPEPEPEPETEDAGQ